MLIESFQWMTGQRKLLLLDFNTTPLLVIRDCTWGKRYFSVTSLNNVWLCSSTNYQQSETSLENPPADLASVSESPNQNVRWINPDQLLVLNQDHRCLKKIRCLSFWGKHGVTCVCVLPVYERLQQCVVAVVQLQQVRGQTEVAAQCLPLTRTCNYSTKTHHFQLKFNNQNNCKSI